MQMRIVSSALVLMGLVVACAACSDDEAPAPTSVAAEVGSTTISTRQLKREVLYLKRTYRRVYRDHPQTPRTILRQLIREEWARQEAVDRGIDLPRGPISRAAMRTFVHEQLRSVALSGRRLSITDGEARAYFVSHRAELAQPAHRLTVIIEARTRKRGIEASKALHEGKDSAEVRARYGGGVPNVTGDRTGLAVVYRGQNQLPHGLEPVVFGARPGAVVGPVAAGSIWYVVKVLEAVPEAPPELARSRKQIVRQLKAEKISKYYEGFLRDLQRKYRPRTTCGQHYRVPECGDRMSRHRGT